MHKSYHAEIIRSAIGDAFSLEALDHIISTNLGQDSLLNLLKGHYHFDANAYRKAYRYVQKQDQVVLKCLAAGKITLCWATFGRLTHALQDFYAHTNYIKLRRAKNPAFNLSNGRRVDPIDAQILDSDTLYAARVYYPLEALTIFPELVPRLKRMLPADSHANMNLDSPDSGENFFFAMSAAIRRTEITCADICRRIADQLGVEALEKFTGQSNI